MKANPAELLFDPFRYIAGGHALGLGMVVLVVTSALSWHWNVSMASLQHIQYLDQPFHVHLLIGLVNWLAPVLVLWPAGRWLSGRRFRLLDLAGTLSLAQWPARVRVFVLAPGPVRAMYEASTGDPGWVAALADRTILVTITLISIPLMLWMLWLSWRAFSVSCNVSGVKAIAVFTACIIAASLASFFVNGWIIHP